MIALFLRFLQFGLTAFGGPAAHIAYLEREYVRRKKEFTEEEFANYIGLTNLIPGPNSTELVQLIGFRYGGIIGLWLSGIAFILPAFLIVVVLAWLYVQYGKFSGLDLAFKGMTPVVIALLLSTLWSLRAIFWQTYERRIIFASCLIMAYFGLPELTILLAAASLAWIQSRWFTSRSMELGSLFWIFLKIGGLLYGSGYVLFAYLDREFVQNRAVLSSQQIMDAVVIGQLTPGPLFTSASFIGFLQQGLPGAMTATLGIFLPSFLLTTLLALWGRQQILGSAPPQVLSLVRGLNIGSLALLAVTVAHSFRQVFMAESNLNISIGFDVIYLIVFLGALALFMFSKVPTWLVLTMGALFGWSLKFLL